MNDPLAGLDEATARLREAWVADAAGRVPASGLGDRLIAVNTALSGLRRATDALQSAVAAEIARESRPEMGSEGLARKQGFRTPATLIATTLGTTTGEAKDLVKVGEATAPRTALTGAAMPAKHPWVAEGIAGGSLSTKAASLIVTMLDRAALRATTADLDTAEQILVERADGLSIDQLKTLIAQAQAYIDPDGLKPSEREAYAEREFRMYERDGRFHVNGQFPAAEGAILRAALEAFVSAEFRAAKIGGADAAGARVGEGADAASGAMGGGGGAGGGDSAGGGAGGGDAAMGVGAAGDWADGASDAADAPLPATRDEDLRSLPQRQADALIALARHALGCEHDDQPIAGATVVVRMTLEDLRNGTGHATIDGVDQPITVEAARRLAAGGSVIPCVFDSKGEILDWGRSKRLFTKAQRLALVERDGGCAKCGAPPGITRAHHIAWWTKDAGPTDLANGVLLCEACHHHVHDNGWEIRIDGGTIAGKVWFIPPPWVDPERRPRLGGRARFDYAVAA